ncbi:Glycosyltransferase, GT2 family [Friedmanniella luteola]|uniref:Glycosyltransferase, GT2 family n=1 Tax=Friedmanniella luteola TaxID=546871 RepID=A0A1H1LQ73_9ACTN|nr:glycosyltransferase [Friedmanniella luteola]SDR75959.1 Glycosyltransferase, GT2 family [Friedmanniella luteola]
MSGPLPRCAAVVVNYGSSALLATNLTAVAAASPDLDVVVVDNFTSAAELAAVRTLCAARGWLLVASPTNVGFGSGVNLGARAALDAGAEQLLLLNPDARLDGSALERLQRVVAADPMVMVGPVVRTVDGRVWSDGTDLYLDRGSMRATRKRPTDPEPRVEMWLSGACLLLSRRLWDAVGGFDDRYFLYWEDVDLSRRVREAGGSLRVVREAEAVHDEGGTQGEGGGRAKSATYYRYNIRNRLLFAGQHLDAADRRRWVATALPEAYAIVLRGGRRQLLTSTAPWTAMVGGTLDGLRLLRRAARTTRTADAAGPVRVLQSFPDPRPTTNPYIWMLKDCLDAHPDVTLSTFSWRRALTGDHDVFHAHWPEILVTGSTPVKKALRQLLFVALLLRLRLRGTAVVRTVHNLELPSGISRRETVLLRWFQRWTTLLIRINTSTELAERPHETVVHGHYRDWFAAHPRAEPVPGRLAYFGLIRRYKAVDTLLSAFRAATDPGLSLFVGGRPSSPDLRAELTALAGPDPRISTHLEFLTDAELVAAASAAQLVVLPYREMHNSGGVLAALSLDRPVLVPDNEVNTQLAAEVGPGWIHTYAGGLTAEDLTSTLARLAGGPTGRPDLSARDWSTAADLHLLAYRRARALVAGTGS